MSGNREIEQIQYAHIYEMEKGKKECLDWRFSDVLVLAWMNFFF